MTTKKSNRREFIKTTVGDVAGVATASVLSERCLGANERIRIGLIGCGGRGNQLMQSAMQLKTDFNVEVAALCDVWKVNLQKAVAEVATLQDKKPKTYSRYKELLADGGVDGVIIATPDFAHSPILIDATKVKKDAYVEKPMATRFGHAKEALSLVRKHKTVVQVGTQFRSDERHQEAAKLIQSGILGKITAVEAAYNHNYAHWARDYSDVKAADVDWDQYLMDLPRQPFSAERFRRWHLFKDFNLGTPGLLGSHRMDVATWFMDDPLAVSAVALGGVYIWKDGREHADTLYCILKYPKEFVINYYTRLGNNYPVPDVTFYGIRGTFDINSWTARGKGGGEGALTEPVAVKSFPKKDLTLEHMRNWLECIRSRKGPNAPIEAGYAHSVASIMCFEALETGRRQKYDIENMRIHEG